VTLAEALTPGATCLPCLVSTTGLSETQIVGSLRRLGSGVVVMVGSCSRCDPGEDRLVCGLPGDSPGHRRSPWPAGSASVWIWRLGRRRLALV